MSIKRLILEVSLKPFADHSDSGIRAVCRKILLDWCSLVQRAETISFLLWTAEGSEILDYNKNLDEEIEWAKWLGIANGPWAQQPPYNLHNTRIPFCDNPSKLTYRTLQSMVRILKEEVGHATGKVATVGTIFDPGPEFAESSFKYERHKEISKGGIMGESKWVHCAAVLSGDEHSYAGFPKGVPEGTTLGTFLGRQAQHFMEDMGFDYLWLSNGFGFSLDSWNVTGEVFDGKRYDVSKAVSVREKILLFWKDFRKECPSFKIETRGSNLSTGMDLSSDASPVREIYRGGFDLIAPVNSPWAALNQDYGLELVGWLSHIAELPEGSAIPFRYYIHDPWWINSPWLDRYGREPNDIYLPLSVGRIDEEGNVSSASSVSILTLDDSYGRMPEEVPREVIPHIQRALDDAPDAAGLLTWVYPFDEYHEWTFGAPCRVDEVFFGDWFMRSAINQGFPVNTVVSTKNFISMFEKRPSVYSDTILVTPAPDAGTDMARHILSHVRNGGQVLLYGPVKRMAPELLELLDIEYGEAIGGKLCFSTSLSPDLLRSGEFAGKIHHREIVSGGGIDSMLKKSASPDVRVWAEVSSGEKNRVYAVLRGFPNGGKLGWVRGTFCGEVTTESMLPIKDDPEITFSAERLMRWMLREYGYTIRFELGDAETPDPLILAARHRNGIFFSGYTVSTNTKLHWNFPEGIPVPVGCDIEIAGDIGKMSLPRTMHKECRVFVRQEEEGEVTCRECYSGEVGIVRRLLVHGLKNATVTFLPESGNFGRAIRFQEHGKTYLGEGKSYFPYIATPQKIILPNITGSLLISW